MTDTHDGGTWLTKAEIARARAISVASVEKLVRRQGWRRQPGNDGRVRVLVPPDWLSPRYGGPQDSSQDHAANPWDAPPDIAADSQDEDAGPSPTLLHAMALAALEDALRAADARAVAAASQADAALALADRLGAQLADAGTRADRLERDLSAALTAADTARADARAAQAKVDELRAADEARKARGRWARLRAAWRGE